jgi:hypothetical protein
MNCVWVDEHEALICRSPQQTCVGITDGEVCKLPGMAYDGSGIVGCLWVEGNSSTQPAVEGKCIQNVCKYIFFCFEKLILCFFCFVSCIQSSSSCSDIVNDTQCPLVTTGVGVCTWLYQTSNDANTSGSCISVNEQDVTCDDIIQTSQCALGGGLSVLSNKCGVYNYVCKTLCPQVSESICKSSSRSDDCLWVEKNGTQYSGECVDKVL